MTLQALLDLLDYMAQVAEQLAEQPEPVAEMSQLLGPTKSSSLLGDLVKGYE